jgi:hypothetical protein
MADSLSNFIDRAGGASSGAIQGKVNDLLGLAKSKIPGADKHSGNQVGPGEGGTQIQRTNFYTPSTNPNENGPGQISPIGPGLKDEKGAGYPWGFTPITYYRTTKDGVAIEDPRGVEKISGVNLEPGSNVKNGVLNPSTQYSKTEKARENLSKFDDGQTLDFKYGLSDFEYSSNWPGDSLPDQANLIQANNPDVYFDGSNQKKRSWQPGHQNPVQPAEGTPFENEDPVYYGFEMEIDSLNSPLINGLAKTFLQIYGSNYEALGSRIEILDSFVYELSRFFTFNSDMPLEGLESIFSTRIPKKHYLKKIEGLDKLIEANPVSGQNAFVKYKTDTIKLSFYEDTNLSTGTLASLYKLLYWDRLNGKNIIPENLLRFDCRIVISEARNIARIRRALGSPEPNLQVVRENVSRYVYNLYECQFNFPKLTHPSSIDLGQTPAYSGEWDIEMSFKFSGMKFERFVFEDGRAQKGAYKSLNNLSRDPMAISSIDATEADISGGGILPKISDTTFIILEDIIDGYNNFDSPDLAPVTGPNTPIDTLGEAKDNDLKSRFKDAVKVAGKNLLSNLKTAALSEAQRQINNKFRLLNNTIDNVRNKFGVGRMSPPTNVYEGAQPGTFFFDVKNSLRQFAGETLTGTIFGQ